MLCTCINTYTVNAQHKKILLWDHFLSCVLGVVISVIDDTTQIKTRHKNKLLTNYGTMERSSI